jgi:uncharacterized protein (TIGR03089 family)
MEIAASRAASDQPAFLGPALASDPARPLLTYYDDATGERVELSAATLGNWAVKTANLLIDDCGLEPGERAAVLLPPHWQTAAVLLGAWTADLAVSVSDPRRHQSRGEPGTTDPGAGAEAVEVSFVAADRAAEPAAPVAQHRFALGLAPMGAPMRQVPDGYRDYSREVLAAPDQLLAPPAPPASGPGTRPEWARAAGARAESLSLAAGDRVLIDAAVHPDPATWLLAPLVAGASVVLCANLAPPAVAARIAAERVTTVL